MTILKSLLITSVISALFGFGFRNIIGFWETFAIVFGLQVITAFVYSSFKLNSSQAIESAYNEQIQELLDMSRVSFDCPCNNHKFTEELFVGIDNIFKCEKCGNDIRVGTKIEPMLVTSPVDINRVSFDKLVKEQDQKEL